MRGLLRIAGLALVGVVVVTGCDRLPGSVADLSVGDCIETPEEGLVSDVLRRPCAESHSGEVIFVGDFPGGGDTLPSNDEFDAFFTEACIPAFDAYVGRDYETDEELDIAPIQPTADGWSDGDREVICIVVRVDGAEMTGSVRAGS